MNDDERMEFWIRGVAKKHELPSGSTFFYEGAENLPLNLTPYADRSGVPVLVMVGNKKRWTLLGTQRLISSTKRGICEINLNEIQSVDLAKSERWKRKSRMKYLTIVDEDLNTHRVWAPSGGEFFALWNLLGRLVPK